MTAYNIWQWFQENEASPGSTADKIQRYLSTRGFTEANNEAMYDWLGSLGFTGTLAERIYQFEFFKTYRYNDIAAKEVLEKFGTDAHCWIPGIGYFNGLQAANYIDSAGTQAGLVDNPVGLVRNALNLNPNELISNGTFTNSTAGWTGVAPFGGTAVLSVVNGQLELANSTTQPARAVQGITTIIGRQYSVSLIAKISTAQSASIRITNDSQGATPEIAAASTSNLSDTVLTTTFTATATTTYVALICAYVSGPAPVAYFDNISVREVTGAITATQGTTANKPILRRGAVNLLLRSEEFQTTWSITRASISSNSAIAPNGTQTAAKIVEDTTASNTHLIAQSPATTSGAVYTFSVFAKADTRTKLVLLIAGTVLVDRTFNLSAGTTETGQVLGANPTASLITPVGNNWYRCSITFTSVSSTSDCQIYLSNGTTTTYTGDGTSGIYLWGAQLELGSTASEYIPTTTAAASSSSGNYYWQFDGSNDSLALSSVPFQMADNFAIIAGMRGASLTQQDAFAVASTANANPLIKLGLTGSSQAQFVCRDDVGSTDNVTLASPLYGQTLVVLTGKKNGNDKTLRINGAANGTSSSSLGATTFTGAGIGHRPLVSPSFVFLGSIYPVIAIKGTVSDADLLVLERWVGSLSGVSI